MKRHLAIILLILISISLPGFSQTDLPNRMVIVYTQYEKVGPRQTYRDYSLVKRITLGTNIPNEKIEKIKSVLKQNAEKQATQKLSVHEFVISPDEYAAVVRFKFKSVEDDIYHRFRYWKYKNEDELNKKIEDQKYWAYQSHEIVYQEASLTSMKDTNAFYNEMIEFLKSFFEKEDPEKEKLIKDFKDGFTGIRG